MKWNGVDRPLLGQTRTIVQFAWFPITILGETRWLQSVGINQILMMGVSACDESEWVNTNFIDK